MNIKRNIIFALESRKKNGVPIVENVPIRMRVIYASQRIEFTTGYRIDVAKWDADKQRVKNGCTNKLKQSASEINADLLKYYAEIQNVFKEFEVQEAMPTTQQLKDAFNLRMKDTNEKQQEETLISFWEVFDEFVKECGNQNNWTASTYEKFSAVKNHLKEFKEDVTFEYFNEFGLNEYVENVPIRMRVIYASQRIEFTTGYRIDVAKWDADKQRVRNGCTNKLKQSASEINADLLKYYAEMQNVFKEFEVQETMPTTQQLKDAFNLRMKDNNEEQQEEARISFWEVFDEFVKECGNQNNWTASTYEKFAAVRNHLKEFKEDVTFEYFNEFGLN